MFDTGRNGMLQAREAKKRKREAEKRKREAERRQKQEEGEAQERRARAEAAAGAEAAARAEAEAQQHSVSTLPPLLSLTYLAAVHAVCLHTCMRLYPIQLWLCQPLRGLCPAVTCSQ